MTQRYDYWVFYICPSMIDKSAVYIEPSSHIYAYTDNKLYAEKFEEIHNMKYFTRKKFHMNQDDVHDLTLSERNRYIRMQRFTTKKNGAIIEVPLAVTHDEISICESKMRSLLMMFSLKANLINPRTFTGDVRRALENSHYNKFYEYQKGGIDGIPFDPNAFGMKMDELAIYIDLFHNILKESI